MKASITNRYLRSSKKNDNVEEISSPGWRVSKTGVQANGEVHEQIIGAWVVPGVLAWWSPFGLDLVAKNQI